MSRPIAPGGSPPVPLSPSPRGEKRGEDGGGFKTVLGQMQWGDSALTAPTTPGKRVAVVDKSKVDPRTLEAAQGMEAMFLNYMMKTMRDTVPSNEMDLESPATGIYRSMMDSETAQKAARAGGVGLADQIVAYLESQRYTGPREHAAPQGSAGATRPTQRAEEVGPSTGGTHEGQPVRK